MPTLAVVTVARLQVAIALQAAVIIFLVFWIQSISRNLRAHLEEDHGEEVED